MVMEKKENRKLIWNDNRKYVSFYEIGSQDVLQIIHDQFYTVVGLLLEPIIAT